MSEDAAAMVWMGVGVYAAVGAGFGAYMLAGGGLRRLDPLAAQAAPWVKLMWLPGLIGLWPAVAWRLSGGRPVEDQS